MKIKPLSTRGFTMPELIAVVCIIAVAALLVISTMGPNHKSSSRLGCVNMLKQIGVAYRIWAGDNGDKFPAQVSNLNGGWADFTKLSNAGIYCWSNYSLMQNELGHPNVLICPEDERSRAKDWAHFKSNKNVSYFFGVDAAQNLPRSVLAGDRNLGPGLISSNDFGYSPPNSQGNDVILQTNSPVCWSLKAHSAGNAVGAGNILLGDGSVQQCNSARLRSDWFASAFDGATNTVNTNSFRLIFP